MNYYQVIGLLVIAYVFMMYIYPELEKRYMMYRENFDESMQGIKEKYFTPPVEIDQKKCSRSCCRFTQWPVSGMPEYPQDDNISHNFMCNGGEGGGCPCVTQSDYNYLTNRGNREL